MVKKILCAVFILLLIFHSGNIYSSAKEPSDPAVPQADEIAAEVLPNTGTEMTKEDLNIVFAVDHSGSMNEQDGEARERADVARSFLDVGEMMEEIWERFVKGACVYPDGSSEVRWKLCMKD